MQNTLVSIMANASEALSVLALWEDIEMTDENRQFLAAEFYAIMRDIHCDVIQILNTENPVKSWNVISITK